MRRPRRLLLPALAGIAAAAGGIALAQLLAAVTRPESSPLVTIGATIIDATPTPVKEYAVRTFGTNDKPLLLTGILLGLVSVAALIGILASRRLVPGLIAAGALGAVGVAAAMSRPTAQPIDALPAVVAGVVAVILLYLLIRKLPSTEATSLATSGSSPAPGSPAATDASPAASSPASADGFPAEAGPADAMAQAAGAHPAAPGTVDTADSASPARADSAGAAARAGSAGRNSASSESTGSRRGFLQLTGLVAVGAALAGAGSWALHRLNAADATRSRDAIALPAPADPAPPLPAGTPGSFYTQNKDFYRVDTALTVPRVDVEQWQLRIGGMVDKPLTLSFDDLLRRPMTERDITLNCVSNEVGGPYIGTARWIGVPVAALLREAGIQSGADQLVARSSEGMTIGTPVTTVLDGRDALLAIGMNGEALPPEHGFPLRMITPGLYGYVGACKWIVELELTTFDAFDPYWVQRKWAAKAPVKTASRIDRPAAFGQLKAGENSIAGVAWAQHRGIEAVEVQVDDGDWQRADLLPVPSSDTWAQWSVPWQATPGGHTLRVRAIDKTGDVQTEQRATPFPNGASGWHTIAVTVA